MRQPTEIVEDTIQGCIEYALDVRAPRYAAEVHFVDTVLLHTELRDLFSNIDQELAEKLKGFPKLVGTIKPMTQAAAEQEFLRLYRLWR